MVLILNYGVLIAIVVALVLAYVFRKSAKALISIGVALAAFIFIFTNTTFYQPAGTVPRLANPQFEQNDLEMQDRLRAPERNSEESAKHINERLEWRQEEKQDESLTVQEE